MTIKEKNTKFVRWGFLLIPLFAFLGFTACINEDFTTNPIYTVNFSTDTLRFDTVFTTIGSALRTVKIYNNNSYNLRISEISLGAGTNSYYQLNVDGTNRTDNHFTDIELSAHDSMYVFVQVNIDPTNQNTPLFVNDSIKVSVNGVNKYVQLEAYGQDVIILKNKTIYNDTLLTNTKPYLIYGNLVVDTMKTLTIEKGCTMYFHNKANLNVKGKILAKGTLQEPITFRGDRFDKMEEGTPYDDLSKQWGGINLTWRNGEHELEYIVLRNGTTGINITNGSASEQPTLGIQNSRIYNCSMDGLAAKNAKISISNSEISNCGNHCLSFTGGSYTVIHCTIANYYNQSYRSTASILLKNYFLSDNNPVSTALDKADFTNCIIYGANISEINLDNKINNTDVPAAFNYQFKNCLIKSAAINTDHFESVVWNTTKDTVFISNKQPFNFKLYKNSPAINKGDLSAATAFPLDITGVSRLNDTAPDIGAYEWVTGN